MSEFEKAAIIVMVMLASIAVVCLVAVVIASKNIDKLETENSITKDKYFELDRKIFDLEKRVKKLEPKDEAKPNIVKLPITDEEWKIKNPYAQVSSRMNYTTWMTIKECIDLLSTDGKGTKQQVKERLEELIKDAKD